MPEIISTPHALVQTTNGKRFYVYSSLVTVTATETDMIAIANIGERDIFLKFQIGSLKASGIDTELRVYSNDVIIYQTVFLTSGVEYINDVGQYEFIIPSNTKLVITLENATGSDSTPWTVSGHGKYV